MDFEEKEMFENLKKSSKQGDDLQPFQMLKPAEACLFKIGNRHLSQKFQEHTSNVFVSRDKDTSAFL